MEALTVSGIEEANTAALALLAAFGEIDEKGDCHGATAE